MNSIYYMCSVLFSIIVHFVCQSCFMDFQACFQAFCLKNSDINKVNFLFNSVFVKLFSITLATCLCLIN